MTSIGNTLITPLPFGPFAAWLYVDNSLPNFLLFPHGFSQFNSVQSRHLQAFKLLNQLLKCNMLLLLVLKGGGGDASQDQQNPS